MPTTAIWCGRLLVLVGIVGYVYGLYISAASFTALIPAVFGVVLLALGYIARGSERLRKHLMHAAILVAMLGLIAAASRLAMKASEFTLSAASLSQVAMALICLVFIILAVRSFVAARRGLD
jgi:hypothetical protein